MAVGLLAIQMLSSSSHPASGVTRGAGSTGAAGAAAPPALVARGQHGGSECPRHGDTTIALDHTASDTSLS